MPHARHAREYTFAEVRELLAYAGFGERLLRSRHFHIESGRESRPAVVAKRSLDLLARVRPELGPSIIAVAERQPPT